jgi:hypothetical protein
MRARSMAGSVAVTIGLLITVGLASRAHPLSRGGSPGSGRTVDILMLVAFATVAALIVVLAVESHRPRSTASRRLSVGDVLIALMLVAAIAAASYGLGRVFHHSGHLRPQRGVPCVAYELAHGRPTSNCPAGIPAPAKRARHVAQRPSPFPWFAIGAVIALLTGGGALSGVERRRRRLGRTEHDDDRREAILGALNLAIDDLRQEPDARRAIIAAYARTEAVFTTAGLPRRPSEAPNEFRMRLLQELDASADAASRLTELFELAKFSDHTATLTMRDEAIDALVAIRDEQFAGDKLALTPQRLATEPERPVQK